MRLNWEIVGKSNQLQDKGNNKGKCSRKKVRNN